jgi:hypothetical protein
VIGEVGIGAGDRLACVQILGLEVRTVGGKDEARLRPGRGRAFSAAKVFVTSPGEETAIWILLVCRTPPRSDLFDAPARSRLIVVSLFPNACRKANGNSPLSKGCSASAEMASSISTAFIKPL